MDIWLCIPSKRADGGTIQSWRARGYRIAVWRDSGDAWPSPLPAPDITLSGEYPGYATASNAVIAWVLEHRSDVRWVVSGGDDVMPDPNHSPLAIAKELDEHFGGTFGVMQPTGDRFAGGSIDRIAGSAWMGREWCLRANQGKGPYWPEFTHMFVDECLLRTAEKLGVYWRRPDLIHLHQHFMREKDDLGSNAVQRPVPAHLRRWNSRVHWDEMQAIFRELERQDFRPCMPRD